MFSIPDCNSMALAWGGIFGCPVDMAKVTMPIRMVEIPSVVNGVDCKTKVAMRLSSVPVIVRAIASVEYLSVEKNIHLITGCLLADICLPI